jgi:cell division transport system permease protein
MSAAWLGAPRLDLPLGRDASGRFLPWIIALMVYLAGLGGIGLLFLGSALGQWDRSLAGSLTVQVPADTSAARLEVVIALLRQTHGVVEAHLLDGAATAKLVEPWLGPSVAVERLPLPRLVDLRIDPNATVDLAGLRQKLASVAPEAQLDDHRLALVRLRGFAVELQRIIVAGMCVVAGLLVLTVVFTARTGLAIHQPVIEVLHLLGAPDRYIARQFQRHALWLGLRGGLIGAIAAALTIIILGRAGSGLDLPVPAVAGGVFDWQRWGLLALAAAVAGVVAMVTARLTIMRRLARML